MRCNGISTQPHTTPSYQVSLEKVIAAKHLSIFVTSAHLPIELSNHSVQLAHTRGYSLYMSRDIVMTLSVTRLFDTVAAVDIHVDANHALLVAEQLNDARRCLGDSFLKHTDWVTATRRINAEPLL